MSQVEALGVILLATLFFGTANHTFATHLQFEKSRLFSKVSVSSGESVSGFPLPKEFRGVLGDWLTIKADQYFHQDQWTKIIPLLRARALLEPERTDSWSTGAWHLAFNLSDQAKSPEEKRRFIEMGIAFLKEGIRRHPEVAHLYFDLATTYSLRLHDLKVATRLLEISLSLEENRRTVTWLAYLYRQQGRYREESELWKRYLKKFPDDPKARQHFRELKDLLSKSIPAV